MLNITPIPAFSDNYIWMLQHENYAAFVDPGEAHRVLAKIQADGLIPVAILITHHHGDHVGGVRQILQHYPDIPVYGPAGEQIPGLTHALRQDDIVELPELAVTLQVMDVPGHTRGHIAYHGAGSLFCGDTLFACGCGRLFEGTREQMTHSLDKIAALPADTLVYCAHEYTLDNIGFAKWVEPDNSALSKRDAEDMAKQEKGIPTVPSSLELELKTNPFLRYREANVIAAAEKYAGKKLNNDAEVFGAIRDWKDREYD